MRKRGLKWIVLLVAATACSVHRAAIDPSKLDPAFAALIGVQKGGAVTQSYPKPEPTEGKAAPGATPEKRYECIVYTKNAQALREKGIVIHSVLPDFVTAWATLQQIEQMAAMKEVTYIESPKTNFPNQQEHALP